MNPVVIVGCGAAKRDEPSPAGDLYVGGYVRNAVAWARSVTLPGRVLILSALHGLIPQRRIIEPYNVTWDHPAAIPHAALSQQVAAHGLHGRVILLASPRYAERLTACGLEPYNPFAAVCPDLRRGYQMQAMKQHHGRIPEQP